MTTPQSVRYTIDCKYFDIIDLLAQDSEEHNGIGHDELVRAKRSIMDAIVCLNIVADLWSEKK